MYNLRNKKKGGIMKKILFIFTILFSFSLFSSTKSIDDITKILQKNADKVKDMSCEVVMTMDLGKEGTKTQTMKMWMKGKDKMMMRYSSEGIGYSGKEGKNTVIINGDKMMMETPQGKQVVNRTTSDSLQPTGNKATPPGINLQKNAADFFKENNAKIISQGRNKAVIEIIPKDKNPMTQKIEMVIDTKRGLITQQRMYSNYGTTKMKMKYKKVGDAWVLSSIQMTVPTPMGKVGRMKIEYKNIKVNQGISDNMFKIEAQSEK